MDQGNARFMKRKVKAGTIEVDPESSTLIVNYEVEATVLGDMGEAIVADRKSNQKLIRLKTLNENTNIPRLVDEILEKCKLIHESKRALVEELLRDLQRQQLHGGPVAGAARRARAGADEGGGGPSDGGEVASDGGEVASIGRLGEYIDGCYEGVEHAVRATGLLLQLAREPTQLETLVHDDRLLGCLTRLLNDEGKKSMELGLNIVSVLYAFSAYSDFHPPLLEFKVGSLVMDVVDLEIKRHALRERERASAAAAAAESAEEGARAKVRGRKAEKLLYVCLHLLLNLAEDIHTERKMCNHGIVPILTAMLSRQNADLLILVLVFLKKLAIFGENADEMARARLADKLVAFVPNKHEGVLEHVLHLLHNLAFHPKCAAQLGRAGLTPKLLSLLRKGRHRLLAVRLLYQLSAQDSERAKMTQSVPMLVGTVINTPDAALVPPEVLALLVNLMTNAENARACAKARGALRGLVALGVRSQHVLSLKALRNMALHTAEEHCEELARAYGGELLELPAAAQTADVQLEALGLLAELPLCAIDDLPQLLPPSRALQIAAQLLSPHSGAEEDAVLEAVRFVGTCAEHPGCTPLLLRTAGLLPSLLGVLGEQQEDDEIVLATVHACLRLLHDQEAREWLLSSESGLVSQLLELLYDKCVPIRQLAAAALDLVSEHDSTGHWVSVVRERKFEAHNCEWLDATEEDDVERYQEALAIKQALGQAHSHAVHDVSELDEMADPSLAAADMGRARLDYDGGGGAEGGQHEGYGAEYGLDTRSPGALASSAHAFGALSEEAYMMAGEEDSYEEGGEEEEEGEEIDEVEMEDEEV